MLFILLGHPLSSFIYNTWSSTQQLFSQYMVTLSAAVFTIQCHPFSSCTQNTGSPIQQLYSQCTVTHTATVLTIHGHPLSSCTHNIWSPTHSCIHNTWSPTQQFHNIPNCMKEVTWLKLCLGTNGHRSAALEWLPFILPPTIQCHPFSSCTQNTGSPIQQLYSQCTVTHTATVLTIHGHPFSSCTNKHGHPLSRFIHITWSPTQQLHSIHGHPLSSCIHNTWSPTQQLYSQYMITHSAAVFTIHGHPPSSCTHKKNTITHLVAVCIDITRPLTQQQY